MRAIWCALFLLLTACQFSGESSELSNGADVVRVAAFDLGSNSFKMKIADLSSDLERIERLIPVDPSVQQIKLGGADDLAQSADGTLSRDYETRAISAVNKMLTFAREHGANEFKAVATNVFRKAKNGAKVATHIAREAGIGVKIISPETEARLGYYGALVKSNLDKKNLVIWDIGSSSMQFSFFSGGEFNFYTANMASVGFKNLVIEKIQERNHSQIKSPNPMSVDHMDEAVKLSKEMAEQLSDEIKAKLKDSTTKVIGIGGVHGFSIGGQLGNVEHYLPDDLRLLLEKHVEDQMTDDMLRDLLKTDYPETEVSNIVLVLGYMLKLGIQKIDILQVDNTDGLLLANP